MKIVGVDPGKKKTGMALLSVTDKEIICLAAKEALNLPEVLETLNEWEPDVVALEEFRLYPWKSQALGWDTMQPSQIIGGIKAWLLTCSREVVLSEQPASVRRVVLHHTRAVERALLFRGKPHARDALRHAVWYLLRYYPEVIAFNGFSTT